MEPPTERSDEQVLEGCDRMMTDDAQAELSQLLEQNYEGLLTEPGRQRLDVLMQIYRAGLMQKAEAWKVAVERGLRTGGG
jgi:hypothetical protein